MVAALTHPCHNCSLHFFFLLCLPCLVPASLTVVNVGPCFRDQYHSFTPESPLPWLPPPLASGHTHSTIGEQKAVDATVDGFGLERLQGIIGSVAGQAAEMDDMYAGMLRRLEKLAREAEKGNLRVLEQENRNLVLRFKYAGLQ